MRRIGLTGNEAIAYAVKQCDVDVVSACLAINVSVFVRR